MYPIQTNKLHARLCLVGATAYGLTTAFAPSPWVNFSVMGALIVASVAVVRLFTGRMQRVGSNVVIILAFLLALSVLVSASLSVISYEDKITNHTLARLFTIFVLYMLPYMLLDADAQVARAMQRGLSIALGITLVLIIYDYLRLNDLFDLGIIPHIGTSEELDATVRGHIYRARGGGYEPGHDASAVAAILPIMLAQLRTGLIRIVVAAAISLVVYLLGYSTSLVIWFVTFTVLYLFSQEVVGTKSRLFTFLRVVVVCAGVLYFLDALEIASDVSEKFFSSSYIDRAESFADILAGSTKDLYTFLFGYGPGGYRLLNLSTITNTFAGLLLDMGVIGLLLYCTAIAYSLMQLRRINSPIYFAGFIAYVVVFVNAIGNYWFPTHWLFLLYPCFAKLHIRRKNILSTSNR